MNLLTSPDFLGSYLHFLLIFSIPLVIGFFAGFFAGRFYGISISYQDLSRCDSCCALINIQPHSSHCQHKTNSSYGGTPAEVEKP
jgi:hypothetical protein